MSAFWNKAQGAARAARILLDAGDADGAINRAYYAMFNGARAVLEARLAIDVAKVRRHSAVLRLFSLHLVRPGLFDPSLNAAINEAFETRAVADYEQASVPSAEAAEIVALAEVVLLALEPLLRPQAAPGSPAP